MTYYYYRLFNTATTRFENRNLQQVTDPEDWKMLKAMEPGASTKVPAYYFLEPDGITMDLWPPDDGTGRVIKVEQP